MLTVNQICQELEKNRNPRKIEVFKRFFKTGPGGYGEGDEFLGLTMPEQRIIALKYYQEISLLDLKELLQSSIHEYRMTGLLLMTYQYKKANERKREEIYQFYLKNKKWINNWDLIDVTCPNIVGDYIYFHRKELKILERLIKSKNMWNRRIAVLATFTFIRHNEYDLTLKFAKFLLSDKRDLVQKAIGWMLREIGKKDIRQLVQFLNENYQIMPRTMLRYSIEKLTLKHKDYFMGRSKTLA